MEPPGPLGFTGVFDFLVWLWLSCILLFTVVLIETHTLPKVTRLTT